MARKTIYFLLFILLSYFGIFHKSEVFPIFLWDESRLVQNTIEMFYNKIFWVTHYENEPDMWNTKPPLLIWLQYLGLKFVGFRELAFRLPSLLSGVCMGILLVLIAKKWFGNIWIGMFSFVILLSNAGYNGPHALWTADYDALLALWMILQVYFFYQYLDTEKKHFWWLFVLCIILACMTKSIAGLLFLPAFLLWTILKKKLKWILSNLTIYLGILAWFVVIFSFYFYRDLLNPGYIEAVLENDIFGRYLDTLDGHKHPFTAYFTWFQDRFSFWIWFIPLAVIVSIVRYFQNKKDKKLEKILYLWIITSLYYVIISSGNTKLSWYDVPLIPLFAILISWTLHSIFDNVLSIFYSKKYFVYVVAIASYLLLLYPLILLLDKKYSYTPHDYVYENQSMSIFLKEKLLSFDTKDSINLFILGYNPQLTLYIEQLKRRGVNVTKTDISLMNIGDKILLRKDSELEAIKEVFKIRILEKRRSLYHIVLEDVIQ